MGHEEFLFGFPGDNEVPSPLAFGTPIEVLRADGLDEVAGVLRAAESRAAASCSTSVTSHALIVSRLSKVYGGLSKCITRWLGSSSHNSARKGFNSTNLSRMA